MRARAWLVGVWAAGVLAPDLAERGWRGDKLYVVAAIASLVSWLSAVEGLARLRTRRPRLALSGIVLLSLFLPLWVMATVRYAAAEHGDLPPSAVCFFLKNPRYALALAGGATTLLHRLAIPSAMLALGLFLHAFTRRPFPRLSPPVRHARTLGVAVAIWLLVVPNAARSADLEGLRSTLGGVGLWLTSKPHLGKPARVRPAASPFAPSRPNLVVILQESLGAQQWAPWNPSSSASPKISRFLAADPELAVWFPRAITAAGATAVSVPTILTGLQPDAQRSDYMRAPLLWQEARALGYRTALFSAEDYDWIYFRTYFLGNEGPDVARVAADFDSAPRVNDNGVDDLVPVLAANAFIDDPDDRRPFLVVVQLNATHRPCWAPGLVPDGEANPQRCAAAASYVDDAAGKLLDHLRETQHLDDTLVFGTADHGESFRADRPSRLESYFEDVMLVPFYVRLPPSYAFLHPDALAGLRANRTARISNLDLYPTILDVWGRWPLPPSPDRPPLPGGRSLFRPIEADRTLVVVNTGEIHDFTWSHEGFALYHGRWKWLCDEFAGVRLFDIDQDPAETTSFYPAAPIPELTHFRASVRARPDLTRILGNIAPDLLDDGNATKSVARGFAPR